MTRGSATLLIVVHLLLTACASTGSPGTSGPPSASGTSPTAVGTPGAAPSGTPRASTAPAPSGPLTQAQLKILLIDRFGPLWYCDPDAYPLARADEQALALEAWPQVLSDAESLAAIRAHGGITASDPAATDKLAIYHEWKMLRAIALDPLGAGQWRFDYLPQPVTPSSPVTRTIGRLDERGVLVVERTEPGRAPSCPICLARGQLVETPAGSVPVEALRLGDPVWSLDANRSRVAATVIAVGSAPVPAGHDVIRLRLADGRVVVASPGHPLLDGRRLAELSAGDLVDASRVVRADRLQYGDSRTFDLLPSGPTGAYAAGGIWLGSTLHR